MVDTFVRSNQRTEPPALPAHVLTPHLAAFPGQVRAPASHSLAQALKIYKMAGPQGGQLAELSQTAFLRAMDSSLD